jgi:hypothetical protein
LTRELRKFRRTGYNKTTEWSYFCSYFFVGIGISPHRVGFQTWCAELACELFHKLRYPRFRYLYKVDLDSLGVSDSDRVYSTQYETVNSYALIQCFATIRRFIKDPGTSPFIDVDCGAGRVLHEASQNRFLHLIGIEISDVMCELCTRNLETHLAEFIDYRIVNADIRQVDLHQLLLQQSTVHDGPSCIVFFLNNPFKEEIVRVFTEKLDAMRTQDIYVLWVWKQYPKPLIAKGFRILPEERRLNTFTLDSHRLYYHGRQS